MWNVIKYFYNRNIPDVIVKTYSYLRKKRRQNLDWNHAVVYGLYLREKDFLSRQYLTDTKLQLWLIPSPEFWLFLFSRSWAGAPPLGGAGGSGHLVSPQLSELGTAGLARSAVRSGSVTVGILRVCTVTDLGPWTNPSLGQKYFVQWIVHDSMSIGHHLDLLVHSRR